MHPLLKHPRGLATYLLAWALAGGGCAAAWAQPIWLEWAWALAFVMPAALLTGLAALSMYYVCRSFPFRPARWASTLARRVAAAVLLALLVTGAAMTWNAVGALFGRAGFVVLDPWGWSAFVAFDVAVFVLSALTHDALMTQQAAQRATANEAQARLLARDMEIKALRNQIDPHFLFNSLNSISSLTQIDPVAARAMVIDLAEFFRMTLALAECKNIRLDQELELVHRYLAIEQRRLGDKLRLLFDIDPAAHAARLPPLILQPLVENAIKHGVRLLDQGGLIEVRARRTRDRLDLSVTNPVDASAPRDVSGLGQGLHHLRDWLQAQTVEPTFVNVQAVADRFTVHISLPWNT